MDYVLDKHTGYSPAHTSHDFTNTHAKADEHAVLFLDLFPMFYHIEGSAGQGIGWVTLPYHLCTGRINIYYGMYKHEGTQNRKWGHLNQHRLSIGQFTIVCTDVCAMC